MCYRSRCSALDIVAARDRMNVGPTRTLLLLGNRSAELAAATRSVAQHVVDDLALTNAEQRTAPTWREVSTFSRNPAAYWNNHSPLVSVLIGLASLDLPALLSIDIAEVLYDLNDLHITPHSSGKNWKPLLPYFQSIALFLTLILSILNMKKKQ